MKKVPTRPLPPDRHDWILENMGFAVAHAIRIAGGRLPPDEVESSCSIAMIEAAAQFDRDGAIAATGDEDYRHNAYLSYARFFVTKYVYESIRLRNVIDVSSIFYLARHRWLEGNPRAEMLKVSARRAMAVRSLDEPDADDGRPLAMSVPARAEPTGMDEDDAARLRECLGHLSPVERAVIASRYGLDGRPHQSTSMIARHLGYSVRGSEAIRRRALMKLRRMYGISINGPEARAC